MKGATFPIKLCWYNLLMAPIIIPVNLVAALLLCVCDVFRNLADMVEWVDDRLPKFKINTKYSEEWIEKQNKSNREHYHR